MSQLETLYPMGQYRDERKWDYDRDCPRFGWSHGKVPEHDLSFWGRLLGRQVPKENIHRIEMCSCAKHGIEKCTIGTRMLFIEADRVESTTKIPDWACPDCRSDGCVCLDRIGWFQGTMPEHSDGGPYR